MAGEQNQELTHKLLLETVHYNPETGIFTNRKTGKKLGTSVTGGKSKSRSVSTKQYMKLKVLGKKYMAHRLAVFYMTGKWPTDQVDPKDGDRLNLRYSNLVCCSMHESVRNKKNLWMSIIESIDSNPPEERWMCYVRVIGLDRGKYFFQTMDEAIEKRNYLEKEFRERFEKRMKKLGR